MRRQAKDQRYGQGGKKKNTKRNTRESASDVFGKGGGKRGPAGKKGGIRGGVGKKGAKQSRPGKSRRQNSKGKRK
jgi:rRNA-processing protein EBP2